MDAAGLIPVCRLDALEDGGEGIRFDVRTAQGPATGFVVRQQGRVTGFLNRCAHVALELDWLPGLFFDDDRRYLACATHGALYEPATGRCVGGPCLGRGHLQPLVIEVHDGLVCWRPDDRVQAPDSVNPG
jgi:nitrite reductase/ring-hydroxylating ferredoxin subunit